MLFVNSEEAWFWFVRAQRARHDGAVMLEAATEDTRPCDPDDIYRMVMELHRKRVLHAHHLKTLARYGWRQCPPDRRVRGEHRDLVLWDEALDRLTTVMNAKGLIYREEDHAEAC
ncbi:MAG: hypothetical protein HQL36_01335 [Alphaproteobacteria bacterium]|nr:hypothetical protein [Alphaproteobacteria bacterium]